MKTKFSVGDEVMCKEVPCLVLAIQAHWLNDGELISYKLKGVKGWVYEQHLKVIA